MLNDTKHYAWDRDYTWKKGELLKYPPFSIYEDHWNHEFIKPVPK